MSPHSPKAGCATIEPRPASDSSFPRTAERPHPSARRSTSTPPPSASQPPAPPQSNPTTNAAASPRGAPVHPQSSPPFHSGLRTPLPLPSPENSGSTVSATPDFPVPPKALFPPP